MLLLPNWMMMMLGNHKVYDDDDGDSIEVESFPGETDPGVVHNEVNWR